MENIIEVTNLSKSFKEQKALKDININFEKGKIHGIIGRNGSGKTVFFKCLCGFIKYDEGTIKVNGKIIGKDTDIPESVGVIIETPGFLPNYNGFKNLKMLAAINNKIGNDRINEVLKLVGLETAGKKHVSKYSLGMRQRLGIAQAIMENPDILILDEPMNGLDKQGLYEMREVFAGLKEEGKTILIASHNSEDIDVLCDTVCEFDNGELVKV